MTEHCIDLRDRQTGETIGTFICASDGRALRLELRRGGERLHKILHPPLDVYEGAAQLLPSSCWSNEYPIYTDARGSARLSLKQGEFGSVRVVAKNRSPGEGDGKENRVNVCLWIEPRS